MADTEAAAPQRRRRQRNEAQGEETTQPAAVFIFLFCVQPVSLRRKAQLRLLNGVLAAVVAVLGEHALLLLPQTGLLPPLLPPLVPLMRLPPLARLSPRRFVSWTFYPVFALAHCCMKTNFPFSPVKF